jgi:saccharopine dehydrogenase (NADP+, L-glutamate forming)
MLEWLGIFDETLVPTTAKTSADILQYLLETKLKMEPADKDMIVMLHEFEYVLDGENKILKSGLVVKGEDSLRTAMAKTVGLPLGIAARSILNGTIRMKGSIGDGKDAGDGFVYGQGIINQSEILYHRMTLVSRCVAARSLI